MDWTTIILVIVAVLSCIATACFAAAYVAMSDEFGACEEEGGKEDERTKDVVRYMMRSFWTFVISFVLLIIKLIF